MIRDDSGRCIKLHRGLNTNVKVTTMSKIEEPFDQLVELVQKLCGGRNPVTGEVLKTPQITDDLNPPASKKALKDLEKEIGHTLSDELKQLLSLHDGQTGNGPPALGLYSFCSISQLLERYGRHKSTPGDQKMEQSDDERMQPYYWHPGWLPIGHWESTELMVDLAPTNKGTSGQIFFPHNAGFARRLIAPSLNDFLLMTIEKLKGAPDFYFEYETYSQ